MREGRGGRKTGECTQKREEVGERPAVALVTAVAVAAAVVATASVASSYHDGERRQQIRLGMVTRSHSISDDAADHEEQTAEIVGEERVDADLDQSAVDDERCEDADEGTDSSSNCKLSCLGLHQSRQTLAKRNCTQR